MRIQATKRQLAWASTALAVLALAAILYFGSSALYLVLTNDTNGRTVFIRRIDEGATFSVSYLHSVNKSPVEEFYQIQDGQIVLTALHYDTFGVGMPTEPEQGQTMVQTPGEGIAITGYDRPLPDLCYVIGYIANHTLHLADQQIPLDSLDQPGQPLRFQVIRYKPLEALWRSLSTQL